MERGATKAPHDTTTTNNSHSEQPDKPRPRIPPHQPNDSSHTKPRRRIRTPEQIVISHAAHSLRLVASTT
jgi:hypothetical protein